MCGIFCLAQFKKSEKEAQPSERFLLKRGPDQTGRYSHDGVYLLHTRLSVVDEKETSNQPIINGDSVLICNGEVYNHKEIKSLGGYSYKTTSDCESIIHVHRLFGIDGFKKLDGTFSFILYDQAKNKVIVHRDNVGKKPLFCLEKSDRVIVSSNVTAIRDNFRGELTINKRQIDFYLKNGFIAPTETIFEEIKPVLPGEVLEIDLENSKTKKTFLDKKEPDSHVDYKDIDSVQEKIENLIFRSVEKRMEGLKSPALLFSGGIDSTVLGLYMLKINKNIPFISVKQPLPFLNDEPYIRYASRIFKKKVIFVDIYKTLISELENFIKNLDQPLSVYSYYFLSALSIKAKEFGRVLFTGDGGDELFLGYGQIDDWLEERKLEKSVKSELRTGPKVPVWMSDLGLRLVTIDLIGHGFVKIDKATAENQMEARNPFLDWNLMSFVRNIPADYWRKTAITKYPLKRILLENGFKKKFVHRPKIGFSYPFRYRMFPQYRYLLNYINKNVKKIEHYHDFSPGKMSYFKLYKNFDYYWKIFVLLKYFEYNNI